jgi:hypothetical protein
MLCRRHFLDFRISIDFTDKLPANEAMRGAIESETWRGARCPTKRIR